MTPQEARKKIRRGEITTPTAGLCPGYAQGNLVILRRELAYDFLLFAMRNPRPCPILAVSDAGSRSLNELGENIDIARDIPKYRIYRQGQLEGEYQDIDAFWEKDFVSFLIGCSFSFEAELLEQGIPVRHIEENCNVPMYKTNIPCRPSGVFRGNMVVSMRPMTREQAIRAAVITGQMPRVHGAPVHMGEPEEIGIKDLDTPDFGTRVTIGKEEIPVFWPCGVTPQNVVMEAKPELVITHAPGHMLITDIKNSQLK